MKADLVCENQQLVPKNINSTWFQSKAQRRREKVASREKYSQVENQLD